MWCVTGTGIVLHFSDIECDKVIALLNNFILFRTIFSMGQYTLAQNDDLLILKLKVYLVYAGFAVGCPQVEQSRQDPTGQLFSSFCYTTD